MVGASELRFKIDEVQDGFGRFIVEPLAKGFGQTLGNSLRRVLLSSLPGAAITELRIEGVSHQFSTIKGIKEDVIQLTLNLKKVRLRLEKDEPSALKIAAKGKKEVKAGNIEVPSGVTIANPDLHLATLTTTRSKLEADLLAEPGIGFSPSEERESSRLGAIVLDAVFTPVLRVAYKVEPTRFGHVANLDRLVLEVETDGTITPQEAFLKSSEMLMRYFYQLAQGEREEEEETPPEKPKMSEREKSHPLEDLELPTRVTNSLKKGRIETCGDLMDFVWEKGYEALAEVPNVGKKSIDEVKRKVAERGWE